MHFIFARQDDYPHSLSMYRFPPMMNISLQEFETYAYERSKGMLSFSLITIILLVYRNTIRF